MFFTFLNKDDSCFFDLSVFTDYSPQQVLFYYYNSAVKIPLEIYFQIKVQAEAKRQESCCWEWMELFDSVLEALPDLDNLKENEYITVMGPYYYNKYNCRFYFVKNITPQSEFITSQDLAAIMELDTPPAVNKDIQIYRQSKKDNKKTARNKNELIKNIDITLIALKEIERLNRHVNYLNKLLEQRYRIVEQKDELSPVEPDNLPEKPHRAEENGYEKSNLIPFKFIKSPQNRQNGMKSNNNFNHKMKVYFIRYREYEKACDRYKQALEKWSQDGKEFIDICFNDIKTAEKNLEAAYKNLHLYNRILAKSFVHADYQDIKTLEIFKYFLETGRADDLQSCINIFEEERHWREIKASQERIENTIYFLQNENDFTRFADEHIVQMLKHANKPPLLPVED